MLGQDFIVNYSSGWRQEQICTSQDISYEQIIQTKSIDEQSVSNIDWSQSWKNYLKSPKSEVL